MTASRDTVAGQTRALELALERAPIEHVLGVLVETIEQEASGVVAVIQLLEDGRRLRHGASPSLPDAYRAALDGMEIGPSAGTCGAAAFTRQAAVSDDIEHDPRWVTHKELALAHGLRACWSQPIVGKRGDVLGTFALYQKKIGEPSHAAREAVELVAHTAALVIERDREARERAAAEDQLALQIRALERMHVLATRLAQIDDLRKQLEEILAAAAELAGTTIGMLSVYAPATGALEVGASLNFPARAIEAIRDITGGPTRMPAGSAFASSQRTIVEDTESDPRFVGYRRIARDVGFRAAHSTPIFTRTGELLGVLSLHPRDVGRPSPLQLQLADMCALHAADAIEAARDRERLTLLADNMAQIAWIADERGSAIWFNKRWLEYTGQRLDDSLGWGWAAAHHPDHVGPVLGRLHASLARGAQHEDTFPLRDAAGDYRWFLTRVMPIRDATGRVTRWFGTSTDISAEREAQHALEAANQTKDRFLAVLSHELRTPLSPILMAASAMEDDPALPVAVRGRLRMIRKNVELETKMIDDLLDLSRVASGKLVLETEAVSVAETIDDVLEVCRSSTEAKNLRVKFTHDGEGVVAADPARMRQILWNLLKNAAKFTPQGGTITVRCEVDEDAKQVVIVVRDTGIGIEKEALGRVFDAFEQADAAITRQFGGLGLGLAISKSLTELHGGTIAAASEGKGRGATFTIRLPRTSEAAKKRSRPMAVPKSAGRGRKRLLVVDDHADTAEILSTILGSNGYDVSVAATAADAYTLVAGGAYDLVISDVGLPDASGYDLMRRIREVVPAQKAIAISGWGRDEDLREGRAAGFTAHLVKPMGFQQLLETIDRVLKK